MNDLFLRACRGEPVERPPVWIMRQAGRYLPEYRAVRAEVDFLTLCRTPERVAEVTLQPIDRLGVDAAIVFADILLPLDAMGAGLAFEKGEGPVFERPVRSLADLETLSVPDVDAALGYVFDAIALVRRRLAGRVPLLGFAGSPWTLAAYLVEGGTSKSFGHLLGWSYRDPEGLLALLDILADVTVDYLHGQIAAGAQALQVFDTWGGLLERRRWAELARPSLEKVLGAMAGTVPLIYYGNGTAHLLEELATLPVDVLSVDWRVGLDEVRAIVGEGITLQGNLDPAALHGDPARLPALVRDIVDRARGGGHVMNLGHGILPDTPPENALAFVQAVQAIRY